SKLGIKPVESGLAMTYVFEEGLIITQEQLKIDLDEIKHDIERAYADSLALSLSAAYPTEENMAILLQIAHTQAYALSINAAIPTEETIEDLVRKAHAEMLSLSSKLPNELRPK